MQFDRSFTGITDYTAWVRLFLGVKYPYVRTGCDCVAQLIVYVYIGNL